MIWAGLPPAAPPMTNLFFQRVSVTVEANSSRIETVLRDVQGSENRADEKIAASYPSI
jgi:hypothetical protein